MKISQHEFSKTFSVNDIGFEKNGCLAAELFSSLRNIKMFTLVFDVVPVDAKVDWHVNIEFFKK